MAEVSTLKIHAFFLHIAQKEISSSLFYFLDLFILAFICCRHQLALSPIPSLVCGFPLWPLRFRNDTDTPSVFQSLSDSPVTIWTGQKGTIAHLCRDFGSSLNTETQNTGNIFFVNVCYDAKKATGYHCLEKNAGIHNYWYVLTFNCFRAIKVFFRISLS